MYGVCRMKGFIEILQVRLTCGVGARSYKATYGIINECSSVSIVRHRSFYSTWMVLSTLSWVIALHRSSKSDTFSSKKHSDCPIRTRTYKGIYHVASDYVTSQIGRASCRERV